MKKLMIMAAFSFFAVAAANAQVTPAETETEDTTSMQMEEATPMQDERKEIELSEAPEAVQTAFQDSEYADWEVVSAYEVTSDEGTTYEMTISDGSTEETVVFDESGAIQEQE